MKTNDIAPKDFLGYEDVPHLVLRLALPAVVAQIVSLLYNIVDRMFIGHMASGSTLALTSLGVCFPLITIVMAFTALVTSGSAPRSSIFLGKKDKETAEQIMGNSFSALLIVSVILTFLMLFFTRPLLYFFGASDDTIDLAVTYLTIYALGTIFVQLALGMNGFIIAQGFSRIGMISVLIGAGLNIALDPLFIFVFHLGVAGAALATIIAQAFSAFYVMHFLLSDLSVLRLKRANLHIKKKILFPSLFLGLGPFIMTSTQSAMFAAFNINLLRYGGDLAVGSMTIAMSFTSLSHQLVSGVGQGAQPVISYNFGSHNKERLNQAIKVLFISSLLITFFLFFCIELKPGLFIGLFTNDPQLYSLTTWALRIYASSCGIFGLQIAAQMTFTSLGEAKVSSSIAILRKIILLVPLIFILPRVMSNKLLGVFLAEPISDTISVLYTMVMFYFVIKRINQKMVH